MQKKLQSKIRIPIKPNARTLKMGDKEVVIPTLSIYHSELLRNSDSGSIYGIIKPLVDKIIINPTKSEFEFILIHIVNHNKLIKSVVKVDGETFRVDDITLNNKTKFELLGEEIEFDNVYPDDIQITPLAYLDSKVKSNFIFNRKGTPIEALKIYYEMTETIKVQGDNGSEYNGLGELLDLFGGDE